MKTCSKCGEEKSFDEFGKDKQKKDGYRGVCKVCRKPAVLESANKYYQKHADRINAGKRQDRLDNPERYDAINAKRRERRANDPEWREMTNSRQRVINRERMKDPVKRKKQNEACLRCYYANPLPHRQAWARYKAAKVSQTPAWADKDAIDAFYAEAKRLEKLTGIKFHVDHIIPLQGDLVTGLHIETNLQLLPAHENIGKSNSFDPQTFCA